MKTFCQRIIRLLLLAALLPCVSRTASAQILISNYTTFTNALATSTGTVTNFLTNSVINLTAGQTLEISNNMEIDGGTNSIVIDGSEATRLFHVHPNCQLILNNLQLFDGLAVNGGAIYNEGALIASNCLFGGNVASNASGVTGGANTSGNGGDGSSGGGAAGGAIYSVGPLELYYCVFGTNSAIGGDGGGGGDSTASGGNGGNGGNGGSALGGAVFSSGSSNVFVETEFIGNDCGAGSGAAGGGASAGDTGPGGTGGQARGGAVYVTTSLIASGCLFFDNSDTAGATAPAQVLSSGGGSDGLAGGAAAGGGLYLTGGVTNAFVENSTFINNSCAGGAGGGAAGANTTAGNGGAAAGGGLASAAAFALVRNCTLVTNTLAGGTMGAASGTDGVNGVAGQTSGWDINASAGTLRLANSILSGGGVPPDSAPNAAGVIDGGNNVSSDGTPAPSTSTTVVYTDPGLAPALSTNGGPGIGNFSPELVTLEPPFIGQIIVFGPAFNLLTLPLLSNSPAQGMIAGVPGVTFPALDARQLPRPTPASAGAFEPTNRVLSVNTNIGPPSITTQPANQISLLGLRVSFSVAAAPNVNDPNPLGYQWQLNGTNILDNSIFSGVNRSTLAVGTVNAADDGYYQVIVSPSVLDGAITSSNAVLTLPLPVGIKSQPAARLNQPASGVADFRVTVTGGPPFTYQWFSNGVALIDEGEFHGSATSNLTINPVSFSDEAGYSVVVSNFFRTVTSVVARLTVVPDKTRPTVAITSPTAGARTTSSIVSGTASDNAQVANVLWRITNFYNGTTTVVTNNVVPGNGTTRKTWAITNVLPGTNIVAVQSVDASGNVSTVVTRRYFYAVPADFTLIINGTGNVSRTESITGPTPDGGISAMLNLGEGYTLAARPDVESSFINWMSNGVALSANPLHFIMTPDVVIEANFTTNPFIVPAGTYNGLFFNTNTNNGVTEQTAGMLSQLSVNSRSDYSGRLLLDGAAYPFSGKFALNGFATNQINRSAARGGPVTVQMQLLSSNGTIAGEVSGANEGEEWTSALSAEVTRPASSSAAYTMLLAPPTNAPAGIPPGYGYALLTNHNGHLNLTGGLADGTIFSQSAPVGLSGNVPLYANLYGSAGLLLGWINVASGQPQGETNLTWIKPAARSGIYAGGFTNLLSVMGSAWDAAALFPFSSGTLTITNASLNLPFPVSLSNNTALVTNSWATNSLTGTINLNTGALRIVFGTGNGAQTLTGFGACLQNTTTAGGYFVTSTNAGSILLEP
jgi:hypothetical protein